MVPLIIKPLHKCPELASMESSGDYSWLQLMSAFRDSVARKAAELVKYYSPLKGPPLSSVGLLVVVPFVHSPTPES